MIDFWLQNELNLNLPKLSIYGFGFKFKKLSEYGFGFGLEPILI